MTGSSAQSSSQALGLRRPAVDPVIALALGLAFLGESPGAGALVGLVLILVGSWLPTRREPRIDAPPISSAA